MFNIGDLVILKSEKKPIVYKIENIIDNSYYLKGFTHRSKIVEEMSNLEIAPNNLVEKEKKICSKYESNIKIQYRGIKQKKVLMGKILHIDGDKEYLESCLSLYEEVGIFAQGLHVNEKKIKNIIESTILDITPDIIVITGHDSYNNKGKRDLNNYENSREFYQTARIIRKHYNSDDIVVIIGACASHFEALIASGANFASSPKRINIHTYDPAVIAIKVASTSCNKTIDFENMLKHIENGRDAFGGIETKGKMKLLY